ncbi:helix-hairpin-helix domain-containing protein [Tepidanaerobacter sp. GT38]|uniref:helix-hairpin-helix domain-containing protein n=1 Tax=Tepidanaerobacter sp. GT38 TaxID=2722793 RepID=UPI001F2164FB|nr:helix-hairpin-helix domain-containing protein [Tepidanaerobacter sp. GT38]MCG1012794.1 helix-hairpin-helix domain-containing protein [Tepidanaerobacter sp. GT38]
MFDFSKREKILLGLLLVLIISVISISYYAFFRKEPEIAFKLQDEPAIPVAASKVEAEKIVVHVAGAVKNPGVYTLDEGKRVKDAIEIAGGALPEADLLRLNLAQKIHDEDKLYVPKIGETPEQLEQANESYGATVGISSKSDGKVNINTADETELIQLPGIGPATAQKIIDYRTTNGFFKSIEDIKKVSGIGDKKFEQLKDKIRVK